MTTDQAAGGVAAKAPAQWRSLEEVKAELMRRAGRLSPFEDIRREDAEQVVAALTSLDRDLWARLWSNIGLSYEAKGDAQKFSLLLTEYRKAPEITRRRLYLEAMQAILPSLQKKVIVDDSLKSILQTLPLVTPESTPSTR